MGNSSNDSFFRKVFFCLNFYIVILYVFAVIILLFNYMFGFTAITLCVLISLLVYRFAKKAEKKNK